MRLIIVEDEEPARDLISNYLSAEKDIEIVGQYPDGYTGAVAVNRDKPDILLLDIQLPKLNGFELLELLEHIPQVIFTTAYDEFAIKAFEKNATDYLLKPFSKDRLLNALEKAKKNISSQHKNISYFGGIATELSSINTLSRIVVKDTKGIHIIPLENIQYLEAQDDYIKICSTQGKFLKKMTMKSVEDRLPPKQFVRVHRSYILNLHEISRIEPYEKDNFIAILKNDSRIKVSASGYKKVREQLNF